MLELKELSNVGFGTYRVSNDNKIHTDALNFALKRGCNLYDTASNYRNGASEKAVGVLIRNNIQRDIFVISKAGYISSFIENEIKDFLNEYSNVVNVGGKFKYSLDPNFLNVQFSKSLKNIGREYIDAYLIHNPEYLLQSGAVSKESFKNILYEAFTFLEKQVELGKLRFYGISSNIIADPKEFSEELSISNILKIADSIHKKNHFKFVQFPYNIAEKQAITTSESNISFLQLLKNYDLISIGNRPFNVKFKNNYTNLLINQVDDFNLKEFSNQMQKFKKAIDGILFARKFKGGSGQIPIMKEILDNYSSFTNERFITVLWDGHIKLFVSDLLSNNIPEDLNQLMLSIKEGLIMIRKLNLSNEAKGVLSDLGRLNLTKEDNLAKALLNEYRSDGIDHVLTGMRRPEYVESIL